MPLQGERGEFAEVTPHNVWHVSADWELAPQLTIACDQVLADLVLAARPPDPDPEWPTLGSGSRIKDEV